jgi:hypothetical protein
MNQQQLRDTPSAFQRTEDYFCRRDEFMKYIDDHVNPARESAGLKLISDPEAQECFRILDKFFMHWRSNGQCS